MPAIPILESLLLWFASVRLLSQFSYEEVPQWALSIWFYILFCIIVVGVIFIGAYGIHLYYRKRNRRTFLIQDRIVKSHTGHLSEMASVIKEANTELAWTNDALRETNSSLHQSNEKLVWKNNQLTDTNIALERKTAELRRALEDNKDILGITAHDLKNPLGGIVGLSGMLLEDLQTFPDQELKDEVVEHIDLIKSTAEGMLRTVHGLLERHRQGLPAKLNKEVVDVHLLVKSVMNWNKQQAHKKGIEMHFIPSTAMIPVKVDVSSMQRSIDNLISNAIKYSPTGTRVWIEVIPMDINVSIRVRDEGPGLTADDMKKVFGKLNRLSAKPTGGEHSTGLGLFIVKKLVEEHQGDVGVESEYGKGATFWIKLPVAEGIHIS